MIPVRSITCRINNAPASELVWLLPADLITIEWLLGSEKRGFVRLNMTHHQGEIVE